MLFLLSIRILSQKPPKLSFENRQPSWSYYLNDHNYTIDSNIIATYDAPIFKDNYICFNGVRLGKWFDGQYVECIEIGAEAGFFKYSTFDNPKIGRETNGGLSVIDDQIYIRSFNEDLSKPLSLKPFWLSALLKQDVYDIKSNGLLTRSIVKSSDSSHIISYGMPYPPIGAAGVLTVFNKYEKDISAYYESTVINSGIRLRRHLLDNSLNILDYKEIIVGLGESKYGAYYRPNTSNNGDIIGCYSEIHPQPDTLAWKLNAVVIDKDLNLKFNTDLSYEIPVMSRINFYSIGSNGYMLFGLDRAKDSYDYLYILTENGQLIRKISLAAVGKPISRNISIAIYNLTIEGKDQLIFVYTPGDTPNKPTLFYKINDNNTFTELGQLKIKSTKNYVYLSGLFRVNENEVLVNFNEVNNTDPNHGYNVLSYHLFNLADLGIISSTSNPTIATTSLIYPNPTTDYLHISQVSETTKAEILSLDGRSISQPVITNQRIEVSALPAGLYFLRISDGNVVSNHRFIKQ